MKARLMKYIASTRPTVRKKMVNSRLCASGCRATPEIVALPARPSPTAAPMAPPPSARPPPTNAPAVWMACSIVLAIFSSIPLVLLLCTCVPEDHRRIGWVGPREGHRWGGPGRSVSATLRRRHRAEVQNGQEREDERLDQADEQVEELPDRVGRPQDERRKQP